MFPIQKKQAMIRVFAKVLGCYAMVTYFQKVR